MLGPMTTHDLAWGGVFVVAVGAMLIRLAVWLRRHAPPRNPNDPTDIEWP